jgi:hypothetical protein
MLDLNAVKVADGTTSLKSVTQTGNALSSGVWVLVSVDWVYENGKTTINLSVNDSSVHSEELTDYIVEDNSSYTKTIGYKSGFNYFTGFLYEFGISNYQFDVSTLVAITGCQTDGNSYDCSFCPEIGVTDDCLSTCEITEFPVSGGDCGDCDGTCSEGCVRSENCYLCYDYHCSSCTSFVSSACLSCEEPGLSESTNCSCNENMYGDLYQRSSNEDPCCAARCGNCT